MTRRRSQPKRPADDAPRLPFDPDRVRPDPDAPPAPEKPPPAPTNAASSEASSPISVSQLNRLIKGAIQACFPEDIRVIGELSNISRPSGGHLYFTLKDQSSEIRCVMWRSSAKTLKFTPIDGLEVIATGSVDVYEPRGQYQLYVRRMMPCGVGALELAFQQLREKLAAEGLFDPARKRPLPAHPRTIAVVTSPTGAALRDIVQTIVRRYPKARVLIYGVRVQGDGAAAEIAEAIGRINRSRDEIGGVDVMIVGRGGGSLEDLWAFNEEAVARAIFTSEIPIVSAVGHEVDLTIADFVADVRAATPTAAAELVAPMLTAVLDELSALEHRLKQAVWRRVEAARLRLKAVERTAWFRNPVEQVRRLHQMVDELVGRLRLSFSRRLNRLRSRVHELELRLIHVRPTVQLARRYERVATGERQLIRAVESALRRHERRVTALEIRLAGDSPRRIVDTSRIRLQQLEGDLRAALRRRMDFLTRAISTVEARLVAASHEQVLQRGFTITRHAVDGRVIRDAAEVRRGDIVTTQASKGTFSSEVVEDQ